MASKKEQEKKIEVLESLATTENFIAMVDKGDNTAVYVQINGGLNAAMNMFKVVKQVKDDLEKKLGPLAALIGDDNDE